jgi:hypothetical protein
VAPRGAQLIQVERCRQQAVLADERGPLLKKHGERAEVDEPEQPQHPKSGQCVSGHARCVQYALNHVARLTVLMVLCAMAACGPKTLSARMGKSERLANEADELLAKAEKAMGDADPKAADAFVAEAKKVMAEPEAQLYPEYEMLVSRLKEDETKLPEVKHAREHLDLEAEVAKRRAKVDEQGARLKKAVAAVAAPAVDKAAIDELASAGSDLLDALKDGTELEAKDKAYADDVKKQRDAYSAANAPLTLAKARLEYMQGPAAQREQAVAKAKVARAAKAVEDKRAGLTDARALYDQCEDASRILLRANPAMSRQPIMASGMKTTPEALDTACSKEWQDVDKQLKKLKKPAKK